MDRIFSYIFKEPKYNSRELYHSLRKLTEVFIDKKTENYFQKERYIYSYLYYFYPQNLYKSIIIYNELNLTKFFNKFRNKPLNVIDIGAGLSPSVMGLFVFLHRNKISLNRININLVEQSSYALNKAKELLEIGKKLYLIRNSHIFYNKTTLKKFIKNLGDNQYDLIILSNAYKEFLEEEENFSFMDVIVESLTVDGVLIIIEPGTKEDSLSLIKLRNYIVNKNNLSVVAPCLGDGFCQLSEQKTEWCHVVRDWSPPELTKTLGNMLKRDYKTIKYSYFVFSKKRIPVINYIDKNCHSGNCWNIFTPLKKEKGKIVVKGCSNGKTDIFELLDRDVSDLNKEFLSVKSHSYISLINYAVLKNGIIRITPETEVKILHN